MSMQFTLLGTCPASPIPRIYCNCRVCDDARKPNSKSARRRSSALLFANGRHILFDAGPDVLYQLERGKKEFVGGGFFFLVGGGVFFFRLSGKKPFGGVGFFFPPPKKAGVFFAPFKLIQNIR